MPSLVGSEMCIRDRFITISCDGLADRYHAPTTDWPCVYLWRAKCRDTLLTTHTAIHTSLSLRSHPGGPYDSQRPHPLVCPSPGLELMMHCLRRRGLAPLRLMACKRSSCCLRPFCPRASRKTPYPLQLLVARYPMPLRGTSSVSTEWEISCPSYLYFVVLPSHCRIKMLFSRIYPPLTFTALLPQVVNRRRPCT